MESFKRVISIVIVMTVVFAGTLALFTQTASAASAKDATTKTVTKVTTKTTNKTVKMKYKAKSSKVTTKTTTKKTSKVTADTDLKKVVQNKTVKTTVKTTLTKNSNIKKIKTTVKTTTVTTTTTYKKKTVSDIKKAVPSNVMTAFDELGFTIRINDKLKTQGNFSTSKRCIQLKTANSSHLLHEMGHFLDCLKKHAAETDEFAGIYTCEKGKYKGSNKKYVTSTKYEYFAESYRDYVENPETLKKERPRTYNYIKKMSSTITDKDIAYMRDAYGLTR